MIERRESSGVETVEKNERVSERTTEKAVLRMGRSLAMGGDEAGADGGKGCWDIVGGGGCQMRSRMVPCYGPPALAIFLKLVNVRTVIHSLADTGQELCTFGPVVDTGVRTNPSFLAKDRQNFSDPKMQQVCTSTKGYSPLLTFIVLPQ
jgi:hypothetical protein